MDSELQTRLQKTSESILCGELQRNKLMMNKIKGICIDHRDGRIGDKEAINMVWDLVK